jgi:hypothetical protein
MTTSGTSIWNPNHTDIIRQSALHLQAIGASITMDAQMKADFSHNLNGMVKRWQAKGIHVWTVTEGTLFPVPGQIRYGAGTGATDHIAATYYTTTVSADEALGQTVISVADTTNMTALDNIGVVLNSGTIHWTTIASKTSTTVTISAALTDSASTGNQVFNYTSRIVRPLKVVDARRHDIVSGTDTPISPMTARRDYQALPLKTQAGSINQLFYDPQLGIGYFNIWQVPAVVTELLKFTWHRPIQDFNAAGETADLPQEWIQTLEFNLAAIMSWQFPCNPNKQRNLIAVAASFLDDLTGYDREDESVYFQPNMES